jgi:hypothetical protein
MSSSSSSSKKKGKKKKTGLTESDENEDEVCQYCITEQQQHTKKTHPYFLYLMSTRLATLQEEQKRAEEEIDLYTADDENEEEEEGRKKATSATSCKVIGLIGSSRHPYERVKSQNLEKGYRRGSKAARQEKGRWQLELEIGPFFYSADDPSYIFDFKEEWKRHSDPNDLRGMIRTGVHLAIDTGLKLSVYAEDMEYVKGALA